MHYLIVELIFQNLFFIVGYGSIGGDSEQQNQLESIGELVTIATGEGHCIRVNLLYYTIDLQEENNNVSMSK